MKYDVYVDGSAGADHLACSACAIVVVQGHVISHTQVWTRPGVWLPSCEVEIWAMNHALNWISGQGQENVYTIRSDCESIIKRMQKQAKSMGLAVQIEYVRRTSVSYQRLADRLARWAYCMHGRNTAQYLINNWVKAAPKHVKGPKAVWRTDAAKEETIRNTRNAYDRAMHRMNSSVHTSPIMFEDFVHLMTEQRVAAAVALSSGL